MDKNKLLIVLIGIGVLASLVALAGREKMESRNRRIETVIDYSDAVAISQASRLPLQNTLHALSRSGITSIAITEDTIDTMRLSGLFTITRSAENQTQLSFAGASPAEIERVVSALKIKSAISCIQSGNNLIINAPYNQISSIGTGLDPDAIKNSIAEGMYICPRLLNFPGANEKSIPWVLSRAKEQCAAIAPTGKRSSRASTIIFGGPDVLGNRDNIDNTAAALAALDLRYGSIEFGKQIGDPELSKAAENNLVRVHSVAGNEMPTMTEDTAVGRFLLGARERNIRVLYIRLFLNGIMPPPKASSFPSDMNSLPQPLLSNCVFLWQIRKGLTATGSRLGAAKAFIGEPISEGAVGKILLALMGIGAAASCVLLLLLLTGIDGKLFWSILGVSVLAGAFLATRSHSPLGREIMAFGASLAGPSIGLLTLRLPKNGDKADSLWKSIGLALGSYFRTTLWTGVGVTFVASLLANRLFMMHIEGFIGIRISIIAPAIFTLIYYGLGLADLPITAGFSERKERVAARFHEFVSSPVLIGQSMATLVALAIVGLVVLRSGNDSGVSVSDFELSFRGALSKLLSVRPRTKEFLFGHPLMLIGLCSAFSGNKKWLPIFLAAGAIGQASLLNTFCHIHTPVMVSVIRAFLGWLLGGGLGIILFVILRRFLSVDETK